MNANTLTTIVGTIINLLVILYVAFAVMPGVRKAHDDAAKNHRAVLENRKLIRSLQADIKKLTEEKVKKRGG